MTPEKIAEDRAFQELVRKIAVDAIDLAVSKIKKRVEEVFVNIFDDPDLTVGDETLFPQDVRVPAVPAPKRPRKARAAVR